LGYDGRAEDTNQRITHIPEVTMAKKAKNDNPVYKIVEVVGSSSTSFEDAARSAVEAAAKTLRDLRVAEITKFDMKIDNGKVVAYRARVSMSFKYED
jgi:flavin-binding protein dodecin